MRIQVKNFMVNPVVTTTIDSKLSYVRELMERKEVSAIPVIEMQGKLISIRGIVTKTDWYGIRDEGIPAEKLMTKKVHVITKDASAQAAATMMLRHEVHHLVVMEEGNIIGIISSMDFVRLVAEQKTGTFHEKVMLW